MPDPRVRSCSPFGQDDGPAMLNIFVGNLSYQTTPDQVQELFAQFGEVDRVYLPSDRDSGRPRGFGFVEMKVDEEGRKAIEELDGQELDGRPLKVNEARPREDRPRNGGGKRW